jgi:hypothetical protein
MRINRGISVPEPRIHDQQRGYFAGIHFPMMRIAPLNARTISFAPKVGAGTLQLLRKQAVLVLVNTEPTAPCERLVENVLVKG